MAQFLRITTQLVPDLRQVAIPDEVSALVETSMSRDPDGRPSAAALGESIQHAQEHLGFTMRKMMSQHTAPFDRWGQGGSMGERRQPVAAVTRGGDGNLPLELTSFIDRRSELSEVKNLLSASRLVTLTGSGGVGKTRLALQSASRVKRDFTGGVWLVELADVSDPALLVGVVAAVLGVRDEPGRPLLEVLTRFLDSQEMLLVLDNCEQVVAAVADLNVTLLRACPGLRLLVTSREPLNVPGEAVLWLSPLAVPDPEREPAFRAVQRFDAVALFADRAAAAVSGFELNEGNSATVVRICARLDGLPLAIELAAARMRAMSPEQILERLTDRYALLTRGSRTAAPRQQTLKWCIDWSHALCTPAEQRMWARLSVFVGGFELDAAEQICNVDPAPPNTLDVLSSLVDKSILIREESNTVVRFRMLETVRDYGREELRAYTEDKYLRRRHRDWYQRLVLCAEAEWISDKQLESIARLERELPNVRAALEFALSEESEEAVVAGLRTASAMFEFWSFRGLFWEGRSWLDRVIDHSGPQLALERIKALCVGSRMAVAVEDFESAAALLDEGRRLAEEAFDHAITPAVQGQIDYTAGILEVTRGNAAAACASLERAVEMLGSDKAGDLYVNASTALAWSYEASGDMNRASESYDQVVSITAARGEVLFRSVALRGMGVVAWRQNERDRARQLLVQALRVTVRPVSPLTTAFTLEALAWTATDRSAERAAILMGAAHRICPLGRSAGGLLSAVAVFHDECEQITRSVLGTRRFDTAFRKGEAMDIDAAVAYALGESPTKTALISDKLTIRERQVAGLVAQGLSNRQIAAKLVISNRTAEHHVEHILQKLGFTSRAQLTAWVVSEAENRNS